MGPRGGKLFVNSVCHVFRGVERLLPFFPLNLIGWFLRCLLVLLFKAFIVLPSFVVSVW